MTNLEQFIAERNEALLSLDEAKIRAMYKKWSDDETLPQGQTFWIAVHKAITGASRLPIEFRRQSKAWLKECGFHSMDDGDL